MRGSTVYLISYTFLSWFVFCRHVVLVFDEMKVQENLVFDNDSGNIIGYVNVGDINSMLKSFESQLKDEAPEKEVATHMLVLYVRGIFLKMEYPLAQFSTTGISTLRFYVYVYASYTEIEYFLSLHASMCCVYMYIYF